MSSANPYAPPRGAVRDMKDPDDVGYPAGRGARLGAFLLDGVIAFCLIYIPFLVAIALGAATTNFDDESQVAAALFGIGGLAMLVGAIVWAVITIRLVARNGQTIAKKMLGIKVVRRDGSPASLGRIFWLRNVVNQLLSILPFYWIIDSLFIFSDERQCLHDKIADTIVVEA